MSKLALVLEIILPLLKKKTRKDYHSKFGTLTCEYGKEDTSFYWHIYTDRFNKNKYSASLWIEGTQTKPDQLLLEKSYGLITDMKEYTQIAQHELDCKFASQKINLSEDYAINEIEFNQDGSLEIEYLSDEDDTINVIFVNRIIQKLELF